MHICFLTHEYPKAGFPHGGIGSFVRTLALELVARGISVSVVGINGYTGNYEESTDQGINIYRLKKIKFKGLTWWFSQRELNRKIREIHRFEPIDIIESSELGLALIDKIKGIQYLIRLHGGHHFFSVVENRKVNAWKGFLEKRSFSKADHIAAVSKYVAETTRKLLHLDDRPIHVIYNPVDTKRFYQADDAKIIPYRIFFAGTIVEKKGIRQLVQSLEYLIDDFPDVQLLIAGRDGNIPGTAKPYRPVLEASISEKVRSHIVFLGAIPNSEIPEYIEQSQICCYPSHMEAMPLAWLEVLAMGKVFLGGSTGPGEAVKDGETGFLVDPHDPKAIAEKIRFIFENYDAALKMAEQARARVIEEFDIDVLVQKNIAFYQSVVQKCDLIKK